MDSVFYTVAQPRCSRQPWGATSQPVPASARKGEAASSPPCPGKVLLGKNAANKSGVSFDSEAGHPEHPRPAEEVPDRPFSSTCVQHSILMLLISVRRGPGKERGPMR